MEISAKSIDCAVKKSGLKGKCVCVHSSIKSFGAPVKGGAEAIIDVFLENGCTVMAPTFTWYDTAPPEGVKAPKQNGMPKNGFTFSGEKGVAFSTDSDDIATGDMGILARELLLYEGRARGNHPICSFTALGPYAKELIKEQEPMDVFAPLRELALFNGYFLLMGVGLNRLTAVHLAEQMAGRNMFIRWARGPGGVTITVETGGCSEGFGNIEPYLSGIGSRVTVGKSSWRVFPSGLFLKRAARVIQLYPGITHCGDKNCVRCADSIKGGPVLPPG